MADTQAARRTRRGLLLAGYGLATGLLLHVVAEDLPWLGETLATLAQLIPQPLAHEPGLATGVMLVATLVTLAAGLALWLSPRTGTGFGLVTVATTAWIVFPYGQIPWARLIGGPAGQTYAAPGAVWLLGGLLVALATIETSVCAREHVVQELRARGLVDEEAGASALSSLRWTHRFGLATSLIVSTVLVSLFAGLHPFLFEGGGSLDLLWAPAAAGLVAGAALWLWARR